MFQGGFNRQKWLAAGTFTALGLLLIFHVSWVFRAAKMEERLFSQRVAMALKDARDEIGLRLKSCNQMNDFLCGHGCTRQVSLAKKAEVDSIIRSKLEMQNLPLPFTFSITDSAAFSNSSSGVGCYQQSLNGLIASQGVKIRLEIPGQSKFVRAQLGGMFLLSVLFILMIGVSFLVTLRMFLNERAMMQRTIDFVNNLVHEFQTPLANIRLAAGMLKKMPNLSSVEKSNNYLGIIQKEQYKLQAHVEDILQVASLEQRIGKIEIVDLYDLTLTMAEKFRSSVELQNGQILTDLPFDTFRVKGNLSQFELVWSNLLDNAIKYSTTSPMITLRLMKKGEKVVFSVEDKGIGIAKANQYHLFDPYYRVVDGDVHAVKGFGLGLYIVKRVTELYHGKVSLESAPGKGSLFILEFPLC